MDLTDLSIVHRILKEYKITAHKKLGQNFLVNRSVLNKIIEAAKLSENDNVLEIGPGLGTLTRELAQNANSVVAIEKDINMVKAARGLNSDLNNLKIIPGNALALEEDFLRETLNSDSYKLVANIPYYLTSIIIRFFLELKFKPDLLVLMVQKEVAERIVAKRPNANILSVAVQFYGTPEIITEVSKQDFWPIPKVDSAVIKIVPFKENKYDVEPTKFFRLVKAGFGERRKQLHNSLSGGLQLPNETIKEVLAASGINSADRAQNLTIDQWVELYQHLQL
ncbi:MAG: 16S rRNA (adenine(1518)-N(6)/adenine(1519)-N(6))-dimethyltransferase RsmA [Patescibacteria group bacterium]|nr:16S rRNA (adenine(1518)-N(6)/adenine(1519)-N(6))-dimethyltransferase RsmA [Patescibacteria group bacterium]